MTLKISINLGSAVNVEELAAKLVFSHIKSLFEYETPLSLHSRFLFCQKMVILFHIRLSHSNTFTFININ
ncbi:hypothetical protein INR49_015578, partial [Caranx melampygus]